jgi:hypothetical protein
MKLLVFSDNHGDTESVDAILKRHPDADRFISLGDSEMSESALSARGIFGVRGNYPFEPDFPDNLVFEFEGRKTLLTHGHQDYVKTGLDNLTLHAESLGCQLAMFGHTHRWFVGEREGIVFLNPGSLAHPKGGDRRTYAWVLLTTERLTVEIREARSGAVIETFVKKS